jgi:hypothetical protein
MLELTVIPVAILGLIGKQMLHLHWYHKEHWPRAEAAVLAVAELEVLQLPVLVM